MFYIITQYKYVFYITFEQFMYENDYNKKSSDI